jgi:serine/threonine-protein kinase
LHSPLEGAPEELPEIDVGLQVDERSAHTSAVRSPGCSKSSASQKVTIGALTQATPSSHTPPRTSRMTASGPLSLSAEPGQVLAGKYRIERVLGRGGMGVVVAAHHLQLDEKVALKFLLPEALQNPEAISRFVREARAAVRIKSEHVARVSDVGQLENGAPFMVMEYLDGGDLAAWLKQRGPMPVEQAVEFVLQACEAIAEAHALGIVHRDLKPANLFCVRRADGLLSVKVLDFGISKVTTPGADKDMTRTAAVFGSPFYMSPEQVVSSKGVDPRTDIWSLGVILFELVTGRVPFDAEAVTELVVKIVTYAPYALHALRPDLPPGFEQVVMRCLEKDRERRYQSVAELAIALRDYAPLHARGSVERILRTMQAAGLAVPQPVSARFQQPPVAPGPMASGPVGSGPVATGGAWGTTGVRTGARRNALVGIGVAGALVVTVAVVAGAILMKPARGPTLAKPLESAAVTTPAPLPSAVLASPVSTPDTSASTSASPSPSSSSESLLPAASASVAPAAHPAPLPKADVPSIRAKPPSKSCDPPYTVDSAGRRHAKLECM